MIASARTASGPRIGRACRTCLSRWRGVSARRSATPWGCGRADVGTEPGASSVLGSAPAVLQPERGVLELDARLRLGGDDGDAGIGEVLAHGGRGLGAELGE